MASRVLANLLVAGGTVLFRAMTAAYKQALVNAKRSGVSAEGVADAARAAKQLSLKEAEQILGVESAADATWAEVVRRYRRMMDANEKHGSFYLQSKVHRARERLEQEFREAGREVPPDDEVLGGPGGGGGGAAGAGQEPPPPPPPPPPGGGDQAQR